MKLHVLDLGRIVMVGENPVTNEGGAAIPIHAFLLETPIGPVLFDTGCHPQAMAGAWPQSMCENPYLPDAGGSLPDRLAQCGVSPDAVAAVVLSHLHLDHAGGVHFFPQAAIYVQQEELEHVMQDDARGALGPFHQKCDVDNWKHAGIRWNPVSQTVRELPLCEGVTVLNLGPGHSYGMLGMLVELSCGPYLLASDAIYSRAHFVPEPKLSGAVYDEAGYFDTIAYLSAYARAHRAEILFGHDMQQFRTLKKSTEGHYE